MQLKRKLRTGRRHGRRVASRHADLAVSSTGKFNDGRQGRENRQRPLRAPATKRPEISGNRQPRPLSARIALSFAGGVCDRPVP